MRMLAFAAALAFATAAVAAPLPPLMPEGLGPVHIGMTVQQAEAASGFKLNVQYLNDQSCGQGGAGRTWYLFENGHLARIDIEAPTGEKPPVPFRTTAGIHFGSTEADVLKAYPAAIVEPHPYDAHGHYLRVYTSGKKAGFIFETDGKTVTSFRAGIYPALGYTEGCA